ncbi:MAG: PKD domain-containing protein [Candidatus Bathyarchaeota archaeon]|nr:PKD domain-containing protein [Candidatus Bathyarchaeota archaeon]
MTKSTIPFLIIFLSLGLMGSGLLIPGSHAAGSSSLTVTVYTDSHRIPIDGATVSISGPESHTLTTGSNGIVTFSNIAAGSYQVLATAPGYQTRVSYTIQVNDETTAYASFSFTKARFTFLPSFVAPNTTVTFDASGSTSSGDIVSYSWTFGDNTNGTGISPTHIYAKAGTYVVVLTITSTVGTATNSQVIPVGTPHEDYFFLWIILLLLAPILIPILILIMLRRRRYYVVIQARVPPTQRHPHCPGDGTKCENCKLTPC